MATEIGQVSFETVDVASAATVNLSAVVQWKVRITGMTNINAITMKADQLLWVTFAGVLTLASGIGNLPNGSSSITTAAGDTCILMADSSAVVTMWGYQRKSGQPLDGVIGALGSTDNVALRSDGTGGRTAQGSALAIADTTGALSRVGNGGIPVQRTNADDDAPAGFLGEWMPNDVASGSAISLTTATAANSGTITLTAGNWLVCSYARFFFGATTNITRLICGIGTASATIPAFSSNNKSEWQSGGLVLGNAGTTTLNVGPHRVKVAAAATQQLWNVIRADFTVSTASGYGGILAFPLR